MWRVGKDIDSAFQGAGAKVGLEIWCIENLRLIPVPKSSYGRFYSGSAYIVLSTVLPRSGSPLHDIHFWLGDDANEVDSALASDKALELDAALGCCTVQYREVQGQETEKFLSYFKPCFIPVEGKHSSQSELGGQTYQISLLACKGDHAVRVKEVPFSRSSLNHNDVFILDTASKIFLFAGCNSSIQERAKALEVVEYIKDNKHGGRCEVAPIEDGKFVGDSYVGEFWALFGGYAPIPRDSSSTILERTDTPCIKLFWITTQGKLCPVGSNPLSKNILEKDKCYMLDCDTEVFVWMGRNTSITERKTSISASDDFLRREGRSTRTHSTFLTEGLENSKFRSFFNSWPQIVESSLYDEGREKVAAIFKQQGYYVKELPEEEDDFQPYASCRGTLKVWLVDGDELYLVPVPEQIKLFSGDCYIVQYAYPGNGRDENLFYAWIGRESVEQDRINAISLMNTIADSTKGDPVMAQVFEGKEPVPFFQIFQTLVVYKGGMGRCYRKLQEEKGFKDEIFSEKQTTLLRIQGTSPNNMQAIQVDLALSSLNSSYCYILQNGTSVFTWIGNLSSTADHDLLDRMVNLINPAWQPISLREGSEPEMFWGVLGCKGEYPKEKETRKCIEEPHLFACSHDKNNLKVKEVYNFAQDDLTTEDILVLDCQNEIYVWIGRNSNIKSKQQALGLGVKFLEMDILDEGLSIDTPVYVITEGYEPPLFTRFFEWDPSKANMQGNSFERKLATLKGNTSPEAPNRDSWKSYSRENSPHGLRSKSVSTNGSERNVSPASIKPLNNHSASTSNPIVRKLFPGSSSNEGSFESLKTEPTLRPENAKSKPFDGNEDGPPLTYSYRQLRVDSSDPISDIDVTRREAYLSDEEFRERFEMTKTAFYELPKWRQNKLKISLHLF